MTTAPAINRQRMPVVFFGHGSPMNTLADNRYTEAWRSVGAGVSRPSAILAISAHWLTHGTAVTAMERPRTIHDFHGFPQALYDVRYPASGAPWLAERVCELLAPVAVHKDTGWGLDHGSWSVLAHAFPAADIPVAQLSMDGRMTAQQHYELGRRLAPLRREGVLIVGSGNVVHNLALMRRQDGAKAYDWARRFNEKIRRALAAGEHGDLIGFERGDEDAHLAVPTTEHFLPLLYIAGLLETDERVEFVVDGYEFGSLGMLSFVAGMDGG